MRASICASSDSTAPGISISKTSFVHACQARRGMKRSEEVAGANKLFSVNACTVKGDVSHYGA